jgi:ribonuclease Y
MTLLAKILYGAIVFAAGAAASLLLVELKRRQTAAAQSRQTEETIAAARRAAENLKREAQLAATENAAKLRAETEASFAARRQELADAEKRSAERDTLVNSQLQTMLRSETQLRQETESLNRRAEEVAAEGRELARLTRLRRDQLASEARLTEADARQQLLQEVEQEALSDASKLTRHILATAKAEADDKARQIISVAIQRYASEHTFETTTTTVTLPGEEMKGRIIGRDGRNIRAFEMATGVTVLIDDTPNAVVLSGFDPVRREIAREAMTRLIADGRIHPTRIEEVVAKVNAEMDDTIVRLGDAAAHKAGVTLPHAEIVKLLGRLHFRLSYSQNILNHSVEVAHLMGLMAAELGLDVDAAKRAGLLHDIGKAVSHEVEGPHAVAGAEILKRHGESAPVVNAVASHHNDVPPVGPLGILVSAADAISASRPGARAENMTTYLKRIEDLEKLALTFPGVDKCFAVQAGRELRVFVQPEAINDEQAFALARKLAAKIEEELQYPGQIKITVIRETRCVETAK